MKYLSVLSITVLSLSVGCSDQEEVEPPASPNDQPAATSTKSSVDWDRERQLVVLAPISADSHGKDRQPLNARYTLSVKHGGNLLIRVREPLLVAEPPAWIDATGSFESDGLAQRVLELSDEDLAAPLAIEARVIHSRGPEEMVRVEFTVQRGDETENWFNSYQCVPASRTSRSSWGGAFNTDGDPVVVDSGESRLLWSMRFGGEGAPAEVDVPLNESGMQVVQIELGWKSNFGGTP